MSFQCFSAGYTRLTVESADFIIKKEWETW